MDIFLSYLAGFFGESVLRRNPGVLMLPSPGVNKSAGASVPTCFRGHQNGHFSVSARAASKAGFKRSS